MTIIYELKGFVTVSGQNSEQCYDKLATALEIINDHDDIELDIVGQEEIRAGTILCD